MSKRQKADGAKPTASAATGMRGSGVDVRPIAAGTSKEAA
jgi:hypothetical protein